jgi:hypothetical protein
MVPLDGHRQASDLGGDLPEQLQPPSMLLAVHAALKPYADGPPQAVTA